MVEGPARSGDRLQFGLRDLALAVLGSAFVLDVARRSRAAWGGGLPDPEHAAGLLVLATGVGLGVAAAGRWARRPSDGEGVGAWGPIWRAAAAGWLAWSAIEVCRALQVDLSPPATLTTHWIDVIRARMRLEVVPLMMALGMVGLVLGMVPARPRPPGVGPGRPAGRSWPSVTWAALAGVAMVATHGVFPYLLVLVIEFISDAMARAPIVPKVGVLDRLARAGLESLPGLAACLATAIWIDEDLRGASRDPVAARRPRSWSGVLARASTAVAAASGGAYLMFVSVPRLHPCLAEGVATAVDPATAAAVALGFAALAGGLAARAAAHLVSTGGETAGGPPPPPPPVASDSRRARPRRVLDLAAYLVAAEVIAAAVLAIRRDLEFRWFAPLSLDTWLAVLQAPGRLLGHRATTGWNPAAGPGDFLLMAAAIWLSSRLPGLLAPEVPGRPTPLDAVTGDRRAFGRFLGCWAALTVLFLASLPVLAVAGVALTDLAYRWYDP